MLSAGRLTATVTSKKTGQHVTIQFKAKMRAGEDWVNSNFESATHVFVNVLNQSSFGDKIGCYYPKSGTFYPADNADPARIFAFQQVVYYVEGKPYHSEATVLEAENCGRCGHKDLTDPISIQRGIGPVCYRKETGSQHQVKVKQEVRATA